MVCALVWCFLQHKQRCQHSWPTSKVVYRLGVWTLPWNGDFILEMQPFALQHPKKGKPLGQQPAVSGLVAGIFLSTQQDEAGTKCHHPDNSWLVTRLRKVNGEWSKLCVMFDLEFNFCSVLFMCTVYNCYFYLNIFLATLICLASLVFFCYCHPP